MQARKNIGDMIQSRYEILGYVGRGGQRRVYRARDKKTRQVVVLKEMFRRRDFRTHMANMELFQDEVRILQRIEHPNIAGILDHFIDGGTLVVVQHYIEGPTLKQQIEENGPLSEDEAVKVLVQMLNVLDYLHSRVPAIILRDIKPSNSIYCKGRAIIVDMGGATCQIHGEKQYDAITFSTRGYTPPEGVGKVKRLEVQDIYSLGIMMHQLSTGWDPVDYPGAPPPILHSRPSLSPVFARLIEKAIQSDPQRRYRTVFEMQLALQEYMAARAGRPLPKELDLALDGATCAFVGLGVLLALGAAATRGDILPVPNLPLGLLAALAGMAAAFLMALRRHTLPWRWAGALSRKLHRVRGRLRVIQTASIGVNLVLAVLTVLMFVMGRS